MKCNQMILEVKRSDKLSENFFKKKPFKNTLNT